MAKTRMKKRDFIQMAVLFHSLNPSPKSGTIEWAERQWQRLTERGYGDSKYQAAKANTNHHKELSPYQREWFDRFWLAFKDKAGKQNAAMAWARLGELSQGDYELVVFAAGEFAKTRPTLVAQNLTPIMAQGWLSQRRFDDVRPIAKADPAVAQVNKQSAERRKLQDDLTHFERLYAMSGQESHQKEIIQIKERIEQLQETTS